MIRSLERPLVLPVFVVSAGVVVPSGTEASVKFDILDRWHGLERSAIIIYTKIAKQ